jgi:hypothetical protein
LLKRYKPSISNEELETPSKIFTTICQTTWRHISEDIFL